MQTTSFVCQFCNKPLAVQQPAPNQTAGPVTCAHCGHIGAAHSAVPAGAQDEEFSGSTQVLRVSAAPTPSPSSIDVSARLQQATEQFGHNDAQPGTDSAATQMQQSVTGQWHPATAAAMKDISANDDFSGNHTAALRAPNLPKLDAQAHQRLTADLFKDALPPAEPETSQASAARRPTPAQTVPNPGPAQAHRPSVTLFEATARRKSPIWLKVILAVFIIVAAGVGLALAYLHLSGPKKVPQRAANQVVQRAPPHLLSGPAKPRPAQTTH